MFNKFQKCNKWVKMLSTYVLLNVMGSPIFVVLRKNHVTRGPDCGMC